MELKKAKNMIFEMIDICSGLEDPTLYEASQGIFGDAQAAKTIECLISSARELMIFVNEAPWEESDLIELKDEIETLFNKLMEETEDLE